MPIQEWYYKNRIMNINDSIKIRGGNGNFEELTGCIYPRGVRKSYEKLLLTSLSRRVSIIQTQFKQWT